MGRLVVNGRPRRIVPVRNGFEAPSHVRRAARVTVGVGDVRADVCTRSTRDAAQLNADVAAIQEHFGLNRSRAGMLAIHLTAQAIRAGRMNVEME